MSEPEASQDPDPEQRRGAEAGSIFGLAAARPLRSCAFRWFFLGRSISMVGSFMSPVALAFGVLEITDSAFWLSAVTAAALVPMVATMLLGGGIAASRVPALRRIEINQHTTSEPASTDLNTGSNR